MSNIILKYTNEEFKQATDGVVSNVEVYGLVESIRRSKYPFAVDISDANDETTNTTHKLAESPIGSGEDTFLDGIIVQFDLKLSKQAWPEFQRYHFADFISSQSTMHCITKFDIKKQCNEYVDKRAIDLLQEKVDNYISNKDSEQAFYEMIYNIPSGLCLTAGITTNYRQLKTMYHQRKHHRLKPDWGNFCKFITMLPYSYWMTE